MIRFASLPTPSRLWQANDRTPAVSFMKTLYRLILAGAIVASALTARAEVSGQAWLESYYLNPQPAQIPGAIAKLSREGYFDRAENTALAIGFLSTVFSQ